MRTYRIQGQPLPSGTAFPREAAAVQRLAPVTVEMTFENELDGESRRLLDEALWRAIQARYPAARIGGCRITQPEEIPTPATEARAGQGRAIPITTWSEG